MEKNTAGKWVVFAYGLPDHASPGEAVTGDAANITANIRIDAGAANAVDDTNPSELEDGYYAFDITAVESNGDLLALMPTSSTANVQVIAVPGTIYTRPANFNDLSVTATTGRIDVASIAGTAQTANDNGADINTLITGVDLNSSQGAITWGAQVFSVVGATDNITFAGSGTGDVFSFTRTGSGALYDTSYSTELQAEVNAACDISLTGYDAATGTELAAVDTKINDIQGTTFSTATDSLEAIRDRGDAAWVTGAGGSSPTVIEIRQEMDTNSTQLAAIVADTNELQADDVPGLISALDAVVDTVKADTAAILIDTAEIGTAGAGLTDLGGMSTGMKGEVNAEADTALADYDGPTNAEMVARTPSAAQLAYIVANAATGMPVTFTTSGGATTTAVLNNVDGSAASAVDDQYNGRLLVFTSGSLKGVVTDITDYVGSTTTATITAIPTAPLSSHSARLI